MAALTALFLYPVAFFLIKDPRALQWARENGFRPMPSPFELSLEQRGRRLYFAKFLAVALLLIGWTRIFAVSLSDQLHPTDHLGQKAFSTIVISGIIFAILRIVFFQLFARIRIPLLESGITRGALSTWVAIIAIGGSIEEIWRAATLCALLAQGIDPTIALLVTSMASTFCRLLGIPSRNPGIKEEVLLEFVLGLALGILFLHSRTVLTPIAVNILYSLFNLGFLRYNCGEKTPGIGRTPPQ